MQTHKLTSSPEIEDKDIEISLYKNCKAKNSTTITIPALLDRIRTGDGFKEQIEKLRTTTQQKEKDEIKQSLPAVTVSGQFSNYRKKENLILYSGFIQIDLDKVKNISEVRKKIEKDKFSRAVFLSPSGNGLKIIVRVSANPENHLKSFLALEKYYLKNFDLPIDKSCKDITRLMFLTWDENLFFNENSTVFSEKEIQEIEKKEIQEKEFENLFIDFNKKEKFIQGKRNEYCFKLASQCSQRGISKDFIENKFIEKFRENDFLEKEIKTAVNSAYKNPSNAPKNKIGNTEKNNQKSFVKIKQVEIFINDRYELRNNEVSNKIEFRKKGEQNNFEQLNENNISRALSHNNLDFSLNKLKSLLNSDFVPRFNPFLDYFQNLKEWDEKNEIDFIEKLSGYVPVNDAERFKRHLKKMFVRCIACALDDNEFNKQAFILVHSEQNSGKSTFCRWLCPVELRDYFTEHITTDKDGQLILSTNFIINLDELAALASNRTEINALKSLISRDKINIRLPYESRAGVKIRRASFIGSTNKDDFLTDETGSVRWLCFELIGKINFDYRTDININDVWRQAYALYKQGFDYKLTQDEIAENELINQQYLHNTPEMDLIPKYFKPATKEKHDEFCTATDIYKVFSAAYASIRYNGNAIGKALRVLGFIKSSQYDESTKFSKKGYYVSKIET